jgi:hypothetical protein
MRPVVAVRGGEARVLSLDEAARLGHYCPMCRLVCFEPRPRKRTCPTCRDEAYVDCCFAEGRARECARCRHDRDRFEERREQPLQGERG